MNNGRGLYLKHYGVLGMKWGVRKDRYNRNSIVANKKQNSSEDYKEARALERKKPSELSNQELKKLNERMNLESNYSRLRQDRTAIEKGYKATNKILGYVATGTAVAGLGVKFLNSDLGKRVVEDLAYTALRFKK